MIIVDSEFDMQASSSKLMNQSSWKNFLDAARGGQSTDEFSVEDNFRKALKCAREAHGDNSMEAGLCMLEFADYLESIGRIAEANELTEGYRSVLTELAKTLGFDKNEDN